MEEEHYFKQDFLFKEPKDLLLIFLKYAATSFYS